jgi:penicillin-insensitive murein endopeptidase
VYARKGIVRALCLIALFVVVAFVPTVSARPPRPAPVRARSVGLPFGGRIHGGVLLRESRTVRYTPEYAPTGNFYGTPDMVGMLHRASSRVMVRFPGAKLSVGELSRRGGGPIPGHHSHQNGRDVDIAFYMLDGAGRPFDPWAFANFDDHGRGITPNEGLRFDDARNWELVSRLVTDPDARVQYVFVATGIEHRLLAEGRRRGFSSSVIDRAARVMMQPGGNHPHRNHFHVRVYCASSSGAACQDRARFHPWAPRR